MKLLQAFVRGKKSETACEDGYVFGEHYAAVVDGVTSKSKQLFYGKTPGRIGMEVLCREIPLLEENLTMEQAAAQLSLALRRERERMAQEHAVTLPDYPRACAAVYSRARREVWLIGDCRCSINGTVHTNTKKIDDILAGLRSFVLQCEALSGKEEMDIATEDPGRQAILPFLQKQALFENRKGAFGYPVLNGEPVLTEQVAVIPVPAGSCVTLSSDGYPVLRESLEKSETALQEILARDPFCYKENLQTKGIQSGNASYDDRCYLQFRTEDTGEDAE